MDSPGKYLRRERELRKLSIEEVSRSTRIKEYFLRALEEDHYDLCPPPFYVRGFLTNYARYLGLDPKGIILRYEDRIKPPPPPPEVTLREKPKETFRFRFHPMIRRRIRTRTTLRVLIVSALLFSLLIPLYSYLSFQPFKAPSHPSSVPEESAAPQVAEERKDRPVIDQIKQMELIGPKAVQADVLYEVTDAQLGTAIETADGRPRVVGKGSVFRCENQRVYFFTRIMTPKDGKIFHVWRCEGKEQRRIELAVKPPSWSVYSYISLPPARSGNWKVEVWAGDRLLTDVSFRAHSSEGTFTPS